MIRLIAIGVLALVLVGGVAAEENTPEIPKPDLMDVLGRYQLQLPLGWSLRGTNSKLNGFVISDPEESFVAVYEDGAFTLDDVQKVIQRMCGCPVPDNAETETLEDSVYPSKIIIYSKGEDTLVLGGAVFPDGMFGIVSVLTDIEAIESLKYVLANARPGPARSR